ncbi:MFS transporter [Mitsuokella sp. AF21-1AC]|uniref:phosphoglycerate transporter PgtP n=1 Tax=Mitsuokella sp. AF21-1AC TaxID=2292235 RepID=UPI000E539F2D|nr:MFS transporter [Mitsuokella sp. AF21-1AC]RGS74817.1 MFS transporter [Mitsuokella sp. AF21-1AC]
MISLLKPRQVRTRVPNDQIQRIYRSFRLRTLLGITIGYACFYVVRNNFALSTPYLKADLDLSAGSIGLLSSYMLIAYGCSKGYMSSFADKADPKRFMALGLLLCAFINILLGFSSGFMAISALVILLGTFQGMGVGPCFISMAKWYPKKERGIIGAIWNTSHNLGGGIVAPIVTAGFFLFGTEHWQVASYIFPAMIAVIGAVVVLCLVKGAPENEGLPKLSEIVPNDESLDNLTQDDRTVKNMSSWQIFKTYVLPNKNVWCVSLVDTFVYTVRFGMLTWMPIYLLQVKGFTKAEMAIAFLVFEWAAIPTTLFSGVISDKLFKGYRMPPAIISMILIFGCIIGYWQSDSLLETTVFAAIVGCLIYVPQFLASVQTMEIVPSYAVGSAVGLRGFMSYVIGTSFGTSIFGVVVDRVGWNGGFYILFTAVILCLLFCVLTHLGAVKLHRQLAVQGAETTPASAPADHVSRKLETNSYN